MDSSFAEQLIEKNKKDFDLIADQFSDTRQNIWPELKELKFSKNEKILDLGCGNGRLFEFLKGVNYAGIDISEKLISIAKKKYGNHFKKGNILSLPFSNESFDSIWSIAVFHHIPSKEFRQKVLKECYRVLKKNGRLIIVCWNLYQLRYLKLLLKSFFFKFFTKYDFKDVFILWKRKNIKRYYHAFTLNELKNLFLKNNFKIEELKYLKRNKKNVNLLIIGKKI
ncbi:class I SAM-dependent methyltransferase [Patescibacteria group bacterium]|nr:class I SAM-dependent methyltransferase [Patescibacteria group bacterium]MBU3923009.1 class I SAM-dependent methyltransferase [Patescibacteria group bacterium]